MSYQKNEIKKRYNGKELVKLSVASNILEIRDEIEANHQHAGGQLELVYQAYSEIQRAHGHEPNKLDPTCSGCIYEMNKLLKNWFRLYDEGTVPQRAKAGGFKSKPLQPIKSDNKEKTYKDLLAEFEATASEEVQKSINNGKKPKKSQLIDYFLTATEIEEE